MIKRLVTGLLLLFIWLASSWTLLRPGFFRIHDFVHGARIGEMALALNDGHFPVRWSRNFGFGFGMPLFEFYAPLPYYLGAVLLWLGFDLVFILKLLFAGVSLLTMLGAYWLGKELIGRMGGVMLAALLTLAPYRAVNLYIRGALSEAWGLMALPWILLGIVLVIRQKKFGWLLLTVALAVLLLSHNLTALMFIPLSFGVALFWLMIDSWQKLSGLQQTLKSARTLLGSYLLAAGLAAFYVGPAFAEKNYTKVASIVGGYFDYHLHFLYLRQFVTPGWGYGGSTWGPDDGISFFLGWGQWFGVVILAISCLWWVVRWARAKRLTSQLRAQSYIFQLGITLVAAGFAFFMSIGKSAFIWDLLPELAFIQFPWRWLSVGVMFLSLAATFSLKLLPHRFWRVCLTALIVLITGLNARLFQPESYLEQASAFYYTDPRRIQVDMSSVLQDYIPIQMSDDLKFEPQPQTNVVLNQVDQAEVTVLVDRVHEKLLKTNFIQPTRIELAIADFPGWLAEIDGQLLPIGHGSRGTITLDVPPGEHLVGVRFGYTQVRLLSDVISGVSLLILVWLCLPTRSRQPALSKSEQP